MEGAPHLECDVQPGHRDVMDGCLQTFASFPTVYLDCTVTEHCKWLLLGDYVPTFMRDLLRLITYYNVHLIRHLNLD